jgi:hypothetical protein
MRHLSRYAGNEPVGKETGQLCQQGIGIAINDRQTWYLSPSVLVQG